jgi:hypothetical protein
MVNEKIKLTRSGLIGYVSLFDNKASLYIPSHGTIYFLRSKDGTWAADPFAGNYSDLQWLLATDDLYGGGKSVEMMLNEHLARKVSAAILQ